MAFKHCSDARCQREIPEEIFDSPTAHALGCSVRRSLSGKISYERKQKRVARARKAATTRKARREVKS